MSITDTATADPCPSLPADKPSLLARFRSSKAIYPPGATYANWFGLFNALSWQITLGAPVILYAKSQGATATILGIIAAFTPLLVIFQLPAAHLLPKYGYRRFILAGWGSRTVVIFGLAVVPLLVFAPPAAKLALVALGLFIFNLLRGIASGAWLPWISELIPERLRGRFLSRDQIFSQVGCLTALLIAATILHGHPQPWQFSLVFLISALGATASLLFVRRIPDVTAPEQLKRSGHRVPWAAMLAYPPFFRLLVFNLFYVSVAGGIGVFTITFLKTVAGYDESRILFLATLGVAGALLTVPWLGRVLDRIGSKPVLVSCLLAFAVILLGWWLLACGIIGHALLVVAVLNLTWGIANVNFAVANSRLMMATMPLMGRNHFFALFTVITSLGLGITPIAWGVLLDAIGRHEFASGAISWNRYSIYFAMMLLISLAGALYALCLHEKQHPATDHTPREAAMAAAVGTHKSAT